jgi:hypothetical protein
MDGAYESRENEEINKDKIDIFWEVGGLERGPLSLVRTIEEILEWKLAAPV